MSSLNTKNITILKKLASVGFEIMPKNSNSVSLHFDTETFHCLESLETAKNMAGKIDWAWVDCFSKIPIGKKEYDELKDLGYKLCFVSPELEGRDQDIERYAEQLRAAGMGFDAICTKRYNIERWNKSIK